MPPFEDDEQDEQPVVGKSLSGNPDSEEDEELNVDAAVPYRYEKRPARSDITKASKDDHRYPMRFTKKELEDQLKRDYKYMKQKAYMMIQPFMIMLEFPFKKSAGDSDVPKPDKSNVDFGIVIVLGRLPRFRSVEEYKNEKSYVMGDIMYVKEGTYYVPDTGETKQLKPHFALVINKRREKKKIKPIEVRDLFDPVKNELQNGKPFVVYKELPVLKKLW